ncbi:ATPase [Sphingomonas koreensis]|nr:ATPase [Sphingomonas koreensis]
MPLILVHSPKGGTGSSFIAAQLALAMAAHGRDVTAIDFTYQEGLKLHFGLGPTQQLAQFGDTRVDPLVVGGVRLLDGHHASRQQWFQEAVGSSLLPLDDDRVIIADVSAGSRDLRDMLMEVAQLHICTMMPRPASLAALPKVMPGVPTIELAKTVFVLNQLDDRRKLSRHSHLFVRELFGDQLIGVVRRDEAVNEALAMFQPIAKYAPSSVVLADFEVLTAAVEQRCGLVRVDGRQSAGAGS